MIHATSLRLGNLILEAGEIQRVYQLSIGGKTYDSINYQHVNRETGLTESGEDRFMGVLLTPDVLIAMGFEYDTITYSHGGIWLAEATNKWDVFFNSLRAGFGTYVQYVHELQTLVFAITGEELVIKTKAV